MRKFRNYNYLVLALGVLGVMTSTYAEGAPAPEPVPAAPADATGTTNTMIRVPGMGGMGDITVNSSGAAGTTTSITQTPGANGAPPTTSITTTPATPTCAHLSDPSSNDCVTGLGLGAGVGEFFYSSSSPDVKTAVLEPGSGGTSIVRVTETHRREASLWLEGHYLFKTVKFSILNDSHYLYMGPFAALQLGSTQGTFDSFGVGWLFSFKANSDPADGKAFGLGIGYAWNQITQLGDGILENQPLPTGVTDIRYKKSDVGGLLVMMSFHFL